MAKNIIQLKFDNSNIYDIRPYVTCDTAAATQTKSITDLNDFTIVTGAVVLIKFTYGNTYTHTTNKVQLKINNTTKNVSVKNLIIDAGDVVEFIYNGSTWDVIGGAGVECSTADIEGLF